MSASTPILSQIAELFTTRPFEMIMDYFKNKKEEKKKLVELLTDACFETQVEINNLKAKKEIPYDRQKAIATYWSKICAELVAAYPKLSQQFHEKAVSWASVNSWEEHDIKEAENNLKTINEFIGLLSTKS